VKVALTIILALLAGVIAYRVSRKQSAWWIITGYWALVAARYLAEILGG